MHSLTHALTHSLTYPYTHSCTHSLTLQGHGGRCRGCDRDAEPRELCAHRVPRTKPGLCVVGGWLFLGCELCWGPKPAFILPHLPHSKGGPILQHPRFLILHPNPTPPAAGLPGRRGRHRQRCGLGRSSGRSAGTVRSVLPAKGHSPGVKELTHPSTPRSDQIGGRSDEIGSRRPCVTAPACGTESERGCCCRCAYTPASVQLSTGTVCGPRGG